MLPGSAVPHSLTSAIRNFHRAAQAVPNNFLSRHLSRAYSAVKITDRTCIGGIVTEQSVARFSSVLTWCEEK
jgi:hypothetical protein